MPPISDPNPAATIYADGACKGNPGRGGWAAIIRTSEDRLCLSGGYQRTTNNRMEIMAVLEPLRVLGATRRNLEIVSDSRYVIDAVAKGWLGGWIRAGFIKRDGTPRENADLWRELHRLLVRHSVRMTWIRGHAGHRENEECDRMAVAACRKPSLPPDAGYEARETAGRPDQQFALTV